MFNHIYTGVCVICILRVYCCVILKLGNLRSNSRFLNSFSDYPTWKVREKRHTSYITNSFSKLERFVILHITVIRGRARDTWRNCRNRILTRDAILFAELCHGWLPQWKSVNWNNHLSHTKFRISSLHQSFMRFINYTSIFTNPNYHCTLEYISFAITVFTDSFLRANQDELSFYLDHNLGGTAAISRGFV